MKRVCAMLAVAFLVLAGGCGSKSYDLRLNKTLEEMRYQKRLNDLLADAPKAKFEDMGIYVRPPKKMVQAKEFQLTVLEPGMFDLDATFLEAPKSMHILARKKTPKNSKKKAAPAPAAAPGAAVPGVAGAAAPADAAKGAAAAADTSNRGEFTFDVMTIVHTAYGTGAKPGTEKFKEENKKNNKFKHAILEANDKNIQVYIYKQEPYDVALIFEYPKAEQSSLVSKIELTLESFAVGARATSQFRGSGEEETGGAGGEPAKGPGVVF
jgi:hypothetical protein